MHRRTVRFRGRDQYLGCSYCIKKKARTARGWTSADHCTPIGLDANHIAPIRPGPTLLAGGDAAIGGGGVPHRSTAGPWGKAVSRLWPVVFIAVGSGCLSWPGERPLPVQVVDAETGQPIRGANVQIAYAFAPPPWATHGSAGAAADDGIARLWVAMGDDPAVTLEVSAVGHLPEERPLPAPTVNAIESPHLLEFTDRRPPAVTIALYAEPRPGVELVLPAGYRGRVRAEVRVTDDTSPVPGRRLFAVDVPPTGAVEVVGPPLLHHLLAPDFRLRYADGSPLSRNATESEVGYWWLKAEGDVQVFLVGTKSDYDDAVRAGEATTAGGQRSGRGPRGKGGGRRGGRRNGAGGM